MVQWYTLQYAYCHKVTCHKVSFCFIQPDVNCIISKLLSLLTLLRFTAEDITAHCRRYYGSLLTILRLTADDITAHC